MDDNKFDNLIKDKLEGYEDPSFDESSIAGFHEKLASFRSAPWYQQPLPQYMATTILTVFTIIAVLIFSIKENVTGNSSILNTEQLRIDSLLTIIQNFKTESVLLRKKDSADAKYRIEKGMLENAVANNAISNSTSGSRILNSTKQNSRASFSSRDVHVIKNKIVPLGPVMDLPLDVYHALIKNGMLIDDNGTAYLSAPDRDNYYSNNEYALLGIKDVYQSLKFSKSFVVLEEMQEPILKIIDKKENEILTGNKNELEKHYFKGIGINIGPHIDLSQGIFAKGEAPITPRFGLLTEIVTSPAISFETGVDYSTTSIAFDRDLQTIEIPNLDTSLGSLSDANIKNTLLSAPIAIKYRQLISDKNQVFLRVGYTPYFSIMQEYQCGYKPNYFPPSGATPYGSHYVTSILQVKDNFFYGNTRSISLGLTRITRGKEKIEGSLFYESSLSAVGNEKISMTLFGIRTAYWFNLK